MDTIFRARYVSIVAVVFGAVGAVLMFVIGSVTTIKAIGVYFGTDEFKALSSDAALATTVDIVAALDQFLLGLVLLVFAYGVYSLWVVADREAWEEERGHVRAPDWLRVNNVTDLKVKLLEVIAVLLAVLFLKAALATEEPLEWPALVIPLSVALLALTVWFIRRSETH